ncbi:unnamed protein product [Arctia plantaginis]|uniref:FP protein C-terminal domain-containing protein n=1 Tax=Arctia plantaginis TaxID=874455 RepID=A0A8S1A4X9_ARCPL|nr:unnamed protein product [Arctia plantaginis]
MSVSRTPPKTDARPTSPSHFGSDPALYTPESRQLLDSNIMKRTKRRFNDPSNTADITLSDILVRVEEIKKQQDSKFTSLESSMKELTNQNIDIKKSMMLLSEKYDEVLGNLKSLQKENGSLKSHNKTLETKVEQFEKNMRTSMIEIRNVPVTEPENKEHLVEIAKRIGTVISVPILDSDIRDAFRIKRKDKPSGIIVVGFTSTLKREKFLRATVTYNNSNSDQRLSTNKLAIAGPDKPIYVAESLTASVRRLHYQTRLFAKRHSFDHCWISYGKVFLKRKGDQHRLRINSEEDLRNLEKTI